MEAEADYATEQMQFLLSALEFAKTSKDREKAFKKFKTYISTYRPELYDDDVCEFFMGGSSSGEKLIGLLTWCGQKASDKHAGGLKRSAAQAISLVRFLVEFDFTAPEPKGSGSGAGLRRWSAADVDFDAPSRVNPFMQQFLALPATAYGPMELALHVNGGDHSAASTSSSSASLSSSSSSSSSFGLGAGGSSKSAKALSDRSGSQADAFELLALLLKAHTGSETHDDDDGHSTKTLLSLQDLLPDKEARQLFSTWLQETAMDEERSGMMSKDGNSGSSSGTSGGSTSSSGALGKNKNSSSSKFSGEVSSKAFVAKTAGDGRGNLNEVGDIVRQLRREAPSRWDQVVALQAPANTSQLPVGAPKTTSPASPPRATSATKKMAANATTSPLLLSGSIDAGVGSMVNNDDDDAGSTDEELVDFDDDIGNDKLTLAATSSSSSQLSEGGMAASVAQVGTSSSGGGSGGGSDWQLRARRGSIFQASAAPSPSNELGLKNQSNSGTGALKGPPTDEAAAVAAAAAPESLAEDPLGLSELNLAAVEQVRLRARGPDHHNRLPGGNGAGGKRGSLVGFAAKHELIDRLKGDAQSSSSSTATAAGSAETTEGSSSSGSSGVGNGSVLPTSASFDPVAFLTLVHGRASFAELVRGRERLLTQVGTQRESLMRLVREHFDTFIRSADSVEHFALAFAKVDIGDNGDTTSEHRSMRLSTPTTSSEQQLPSVVSPSAATADAPSTVHASALGLSSSGASTRSRRGSFLGSGAQSAALEASVASLARVDLMGLQDLVAMAQTDARDAFGLLLSRGARLRAHKLARQKLAGWGAGVVDAPQKMAQCLAATPSPKLGEAVGHWRRVRRALAAAAAAAAAASAAAASASGADGPSGTRPADGPTGQAAGSVGVSSGRSGPGSSGGDGNNGSSGTNASTGASASMLLRRVSDAAEREGLKVRAALQAELAAMPGEGTKGALSISSTPLRGSTTARASTMHPNSRGIPLKSSGIDAKLNNNGSNDQAAGAVRTSRLLRAAALLAEIGPGLDTSHSSSRRRRSSNSSTGVSMPPVVAAPLPQSLLPRRKKKPRVSPPNSPVQGTAAAAAAALDSPPPPPPLSPASPSSPPTSPPAPRGIFGNAAAAAEAARAREVNRARRSAVARSPHLAGLLFQASHLKAAAQSAARQFDKELKGGGDGKDWSQVTSRRSASSSSLSPSSPSSVETTGVVSRRAPRRGSLAIMERAARTGAAFGSDDESDGGGDSAEDEDNDDENSEGRNAQGKRKGVNRSSVGGRGRISHNATHDEEEDEGNEADEVEDERAAAALASASTELAAAEEESRRNAKIQAKLKASRDKLLAERAADPSVSPSAHAAAVGKEAAAAAAAARVASNRHTATQATLGEKGNQDGDVASVVWSGQTDDENDDDDDKAAGGDETAVSHLSSQERLEYVSSLANACRCSLPLVCALGGRLHCDPLALSTAKSALPTAARNASATATTRTAVRASKGSSFSLALGAPDANHSSNKSGKNGLNASIFTENEPPATLAVCSAYQEVHKAAVADCNGLLMRLVAELRLAVLGQEEDGEDRGSDAVPGSSRPSNSSSSDSASNDGNSFGTAEAGQGQPQQKRAQQMRGGAPFLQNAKQQCRGALDISSLRAALPELADLCAGLQALDRAHAAQTSSSMELQAAAAATEVAKSQKQMEENDSADADGDSSMHEGKSLDEDAEKKNTKNGGSCSVLVGVVADAQRLVANVLSRVATAAFANTKAELKRQAATIMFGTTQPNDDSTRSAGVTSPLACAWAFHCVASGREQQDNARQQDLPAHLAPAVQASLAALTMSHHHYSFHSTSSTLTRDHGPQHKASTAAAAAETLGAAGTLRLPELLSIALLTALDACVVGAPSQGNRSTSASSNNGSVLRGCAHAALQGAQACAHQALALLQVEKGASEALSAGTATATASTDLSAGGSPHALAKDNANLNLWDLVGFGEPLDSAGRLSESSSDAAAVAGLKRRDLVALIQSSGLPVPLHAAGLTSGQASAVVHHVKLVQRSKEVAHERVEHLVQLLGREAALAAIARGSRAANNSNGSSSSSGSGSSSEVSESGSLSSMTSAEAAKHLVIAHHDSCARERRDTAQSRQATLATLLAVHQAPAESGAAALSEQQAAIAILDRLVTAADHSSTESLAFLRLLGDHQDDDDDVDEVNDPDLPRLRAAAVTAMAAHRNCRSRSKNSRASNDSHHNDKAMLCTAADCARVAAVVLPQTAQRLNDLLSQSSKGCHMNEGSSSNYLVEEQKAFGSLGACLLARHQSSQLAALRKVVRHGWRPWPAHMTKTTTAMTTTTLPRVPTLPSYVACVLQTLVDANASLEAQFGAATKRGSYTSSSDSSSVSIRSSTLLNDGNGDRSGGGALFQGTAATSFGHLAGAALQAMIVCAEARLTASRSSSGRSGGMESSPLPTPMTPPEARMRAVEVVFFTDVLLPHAVQACAQSSHSLKAGIGAPTTTSGTAAGASNDPLSRHNGSGLAMQCVAKDYLIALEARACTAGEALAAAGEASPIQVREQMAQMQEHAGLYMACFP